jgi:deoxyribodipyrimidine photo-lyase
MNPWTQSKKSDPNGEYIKKWMPELANVEPRDLHDPARMDPIVDFREQSKKYLALY